MEMRKLGCGYVVLAALLAGLIAFSPAGFAQHDPVSEKDVVRSCIQSAPVDRLEYWEINRSGWESACENWPEPRKAFEAARKGRVAECMKQYPVEYEGRYGISIDIWDGSCERQGLTRHEKYINQRIDAAEISARVLGESARPSPSDIQEFLNTPTELFPRNIQAVVELKKSEIMRLADGTSTRLGDAQARKKAMKGVGKEIDLLRKAKWDDKSQLNKYFDGEAKREKGTLVDGREDPSLAEAGSVSGDGAGYPERKSVLAHRNAPPALGQSRASVDAKVGNPSTADRTGWLPGTLKCGLTKSSGALFRIPKNIASWGSRLEWAAGKGMQGLKRGIRGIPENDRLKPAVSKAKQEIPSVQMPKGKAGQATEKLNEALRQKFHDFYSNEYDFSRDGDQCSKNVRRLIKFLKPAGLDLSEANVLVVFNKNRFLRFGDNIPFWPKKARQGAGGILFHHHLLEYRGQVLDPSFAQKPTVMNVKDYLQTNFHSFFSSEIPKNLCARVFPAKDFMRFAET
ncbi:MAG: hypothetical protein ABIG11_01965, partial [bacterium]